MDFSTERMEASIQAMKLNYPSFSVGGRPIGTGREAVWKGWVQPIRNLENLEWLLADLAQDRLVRILQGGEVTHNPNCNRKHQKLPWINKIKKPDSAFKIKITYGCGSQHPRAYSLDPIIPTTKRKHMFRDGAFCAYPPWDATWQWQIQTVADFMDYVVIWLIKWNVWQQTNVWLGEEMSHDRVFLYFTISPSEQCWCGSGRKYLLCHRTNDEREVLQKMLDHSFKQTLNLEQCYL